MRQKLKKSKHQIPLKDPRQPAELVVRIIIYIHKVVNNLVSWKVLASSSAPIQRQYKATYCFFFFH